MKTDFDRGFEAGLAQGKVDAYPKIRELEREIERLKASRSKTISGMEERWQKLCIDIANKAKEMGASEPFMFASEAGLCVSDGETGSGADVLFKLNKPDISVITYDSGGW